MNSTRHKKLLIGIMVLAVVLSAVFVTHISKPAVTKEFVSQKATEFKTQCHEKQAQGYDVAEAEEFARQAKQSFDRKDYETANKLLDKALEATEVLTGFVPSGWINEGLIYETHPYYYDGTFGGLTEKIPEIADLGIKTIYLMPIWKQPRGDEGRSLIYHTYDYYTINQVYGTPQELRELIDTAHKYDMKVLFDLVTCCTWEGNTIWNKNGTFSMPLLELQKKAKELGWTLEYETVEGDRYVYCNCIKKDRLLCDFAGMIVDDEVILRHYPNAGWGFAIDTTNPEVIDYFTGVAKYYVKEYDIDGWRLDAPSNNWNPDIISGDHSSVELMRSVKRTITEIKPDTILLSEWAPVAITKSTYPPAEPVLDEVAAASYSYYFYNKQSEMLREGNPKQIVDALTKEKIWYNRTRICFLETHDTRRINEVAPQLNKPLIVSISTIPRVPMIQAGQEIGATNEFFADPQVDWAHGDYELREFYKKVFHIRNNNNALKYGTMENVWKSGDNTYAYLRSYEEEKVIMVINFMDMEATSTLDLSSLDKGIVLYDELSDETFMVNNPGKFQISIPAYGSRILVLKEGGD